MPSLSAEDLGRKALELDWILTDCDGVLTDGGLYYDHRGRQTLRFDVKDGMGMKLAQRAGLKVGILTARSAKAIEHRARELGLDAMMGGVTDKDARFQTFLAREGTTAGRVCYLGDDLADLKVLGRCGLALCPADAVAEVRMVADGVLEAKGGQGAFREAAELILRARGVWGEVFGPFSLEG